MGGEYLKVPVSHTKYQLNINFLKNAKVFFAVFCAHVFYAYCSYIAT